MRWRGERESENVEDRRDEGGAGGFNFPGGVSFPSGGGSGGGGIGIIGILIILGLMWFFGLDPTVLMQGGGPGGDQGNFPDIHLPQSQPGPDTSDVPEPGTQGPPLEHPKSASEDDLRQFVGVVLADTEDVWHDIFRQYGEKYSDPKLVLFSGAVRSACGTGMAAMGPFYCPNDEKVYIDLGFYDELKDRFKAPGDFAEAYVIAHEVGHHVQKLLGIMDQVEAARQRMSQTAGQRACRSASSSRPTASPASGPTMPRRARTSSSRGTSTRRSTPRARSATTGSKSKRKAMSCRMPSPMARPPSASAGSSVATGAGSSRAAILSTPTSFSQDVTRAVQLVGRRHFSDRIVGGR